MVRLGLSFCLALAVSLFAVARGQCDDDGRPRSGRSAKIELPSPENIEKAKAILDEYHVVDGLVKLIQGIFGFHFRAKILGTMTSPGD